MNKSVAKILLVEDEEHLAVGIKYNLEAEGYEVVAAPDGQTALEHWASDGPPDLVILDLMLPGMSGYRVCETIREKGDETPILILSARTLPEDRSRGFDVGADQYLTKPFELDELIARVKNLLARHARRMTSFSNDPAEFSFGAAQINFDTHEITVAEKSVKLTALELKLLEYFVRNEGRVIPRGELLESVWEMPANINTRAPDQIVRRLRKTFESQPAEPRHFLTIRDAGYRFVAAGEPSE
jgi:two-component system OmpR family response regulator